MKSKSNIYLDSEIKSKHQITIHGKNLKLRWIGKQIVVWSKNDETDV